MSARPSLDHSMMATARVWAERGTCPRLHVGAVIARGGRVLSTGYNGAPREEPHCVHEDLSPHGIPCTQAVHAETNAIVNAAVFGVSIWGSTLYTTIAPCNTCAALIINAQICTVIYDQKFERSDGGRQRLIRAGLEVVELG